MTLLELYPALLFLGLLAFAILWRLRHLVGARISTRRLTTAAIGLLAVSLVLSLAVRLVAPGLLIPSSRLLNWRLGLGASGSSDPANAQTTTAFGIEVEHPGCTPVDGDAWIAEPITSYTPWSVTITMRMTDATNCSSQQAPHQGLPLVGSYLMGTLYTIHLSEPLAGRMLLDGSSFPPAKRSRP